jgi:acetyltransferase-like isoleucine patch superfamily enzyme
MIKFNYAYSINLTIVGKLGRVNIHPTAIVEREDLLGDNTRVHAGACLAGEVSTGKGVLIEPNTIITGPVSIGRGTYVGPNCVIGHPDAIELTRLQKRAGTDSKGKTCIGRDCVIRSGSAIYSSVSIGDRVLFGHNVMIREKVVVGNRCKIGTNVVIDGKSTIGSDVSIQTGVYICTYSTVEDGVFLGPCCVFTNDKYAMQKEFKLVGPTVKRGASVGANALLFPGITVGEGAVIGSQAMVNRDVPAEMIYAGVPAKKMRPVPKSWRSSLLRT